jgi:hypothetical protein
LAALAGARTGVDPRRPAGAQEVSVDFTNAEGLPSRNLSCALHHPVDCALHPHHDDGARQYRDCAVALADRPSAFVKSTETSCAPAGAARINASTGAGKRGQKAGLQPGRKRHDRSLMRRQDTAGRAEIDNVRRRRRRFGFVFAPAVRRHTLSTRVAPSCVRSTRCSVSSRRIRRRRRFWSSASASVTARRFFGPFDFGFTQRRDRRGRTVSRRGREGR